MPEIDQKLEKHKTTIAVITKVKAVTSLEIIM